MPTTIRPYLPTDHSSCMTAFLSNVPDFFTQEEIADFERFLVSLENGSGTASFYVIEHDQQVIGCGGFGDRNGDGIYSLAWGFVHKELHKKGFGEMLLTYRIEQIRLLNPKFPIWLDTTQYAAGFFKKYGFSTVSIINDYYAIGMHRHDMALEL
jgi:N-acetylglutamate synthase-like GNAT family acetyltransferase